MNLPCDAGVQRPLPIYPLVLLGDSMGPGEKLDVLYLSILKLFQPKRGTPDLEACSSHTNIANTGRDPGEFPSNRSVNALYVDVRYFILIPPIEIHV